MIAGLGISTYAIREGVNYKDDKRQFEQFVSEIFTVNIFSMIFSYICLGVCLLFLKYLRSYSKLILLLSLQIFFITLGVEWIYAIYEEYKYITIRSIIFKLISIMLIFMFVKSPNDINNYAAITVFSSAGSSLLNSYLVHKIMKSSVLSLAKLMKANFLLSYKP